MSNPEANISASCSRRVTILIEYVALNARELNDVLIDHAPGDLKRDDGKNGILNVERWEAHCFLSI